MEIHQLRATAAWRIMSQNMGHLSDQHGRQIGSGPGG
jgi:uncharacterized protein YjeT (DUF2065 family)